MCRTATSSTFCPHDWLPLNRACEFACTRIVRLGHHCPCQNPAATGVPQHQSLPRGSSYVVGVVGGPSALASALLNHCYHAHQAGDLDVESLPFDDRGPQALRRLQEQSRRDADRVFLSSREEPLQMRPDPAKPSSWTPRSSPAVRVRDPSTGRPETAVSGGHMLR
jgi:hypothetical protein